MSFPATSAWSELWHEYGKIVNKITGMEGMPLEEVEKQITVICTRYRVISGETDVTPEKIMTIIKRRYYDDP